MPDAQNRSQYLVCNSAKIGTYLGSIFSEAQHRQENAYIHVFELNRIS